MYLLSLLLACTQTQEVVSEPQPSPVFPPSEINYDQSFMTDQDADFSQTRAAVLDYVNSVYVDATEMAQFDGKLTLRETQQTENALGNYHQNMTAQAYLEKARNYYWATKVRPYESTVCSRLAASALVKKNYTGDGLPNAFYLGVYHTCMRQIFTIWTPQEELEIAAHPEQWVFYLEGASEPNDRSEWETTFFRTRMAKPLGIPVVELLVRPLDPEFVELVRHDSYFDLYDLCLLFFTEEIKLSLDHKGVPPTLSAQQTFAQKWSKDLNIEEAVLLERIKVFMQEAPQTTADNTPPSQKRFSEFIKFYEEKSNQLAIVKNEKSMPSYAQKKMLVVSGKAHQPILDAVFSHE